CTQIRRKERYSPEFAHDIFTGGRRMALSKLTGLAAGQGDANLWIIAKKFRQLSSFDANGPCA
ncbi:MAG: hypothetical protein WAK78_20940, partial [Candidatus Acidiferrales bacterium]